MDTENYYYTIICYQKYIHVIIDGSGFSVGVTPLNHNCPK